MSRYHHKSANFESQLPLWIHIFIHVATSFDKGKMSQCHYKSANFDQHTTTTCVSTQTDEITLGDAGVKMGAKLILKGPVMLKVCALAQCIIFSVCQSTLEPYCTLYVRRCPTTMVPRRWLLHQNPDSRWLSATWRTISMLVRRQAHVMWRSVSG